MTLKNITIPSKDTIICIVGERENNLKIISKELEVRINSSGNDFFISGEEKNVEMAYKVIKNLEGICNGTSILSYADINICIDAVKNNKLKDYKKLKSTIITKDFKGKPIKTRTFSQLDLYNSTRDNLITFGVGYSGVGKTLLSVAIGVQELLDKKVEKLILCRPAVSAQEKLGYLPGLEAQKLEPYLRPLYDYLISIVGIDQFNAYILTGKIEVRSLSFMRGADFKNSFVILDEAQNTKKEQMKLFLTRLSSGSRMVVVGDTTQSDLINDKENGLTHAMKLLTDIEGIKFISFTETDIVRHPLVQKIVMAYNRENI